MNRKALTRFFCLTLLHLYNKIEVGVFYWTVLAPDIVNSGREEQGLNSVETSLGVLPPRELCDLAWQYLHRKRARPISTTQPSL